MSSRSAILVAALVAVLATAGSAVPAKQASALEQIKKGLDQAVSAGQLDLPTADGYAAIAGRAVALLPSIPPLRAQTLTGMLKDIAGQASDYSPQWALTLFSMLRFNEETLATQPLP